VESVFPRADSDFPSAERAFVRAKLEVVVARRWFGATSRGIGGAKDSDAHAGNAVANVLSSSFMALHQKCEK
jgi:hypothetical protein